MLAWRSTARARSPCKHSSYKRRRAPVGACLQVKPSSLTEGRRRPGTHSGASPVGAHARMAIHRQSPIAMQAQLLQKAADSCGCPARDTCIASRGAPTVGNTLLRIPRRSSCSHGDPPPKPGRHANIAPTKSGGLLWELVCKRSAHCQLAATACNPLPRTPYYRPPLLNRFRAAPTIPPPTHHSGNCHVHYQPRCCCSGLP